MLFSFFFFFPFFCITLSSSCLDECGNRGWKIYAWLLNWVWASFLQRSSVIPTFWLYWPRRGRCNSLFVNQPLISLVFCACMWGHRCCHYLTMRSLRFSTPSRLSLLRYVSGFVTLLVHMLLDGAAVQWPTCTCTCIHKMACSLWP